MDLLYLALLGLVFQFLPLPELVRVFFSMPYFLIFPYVIGNIFFMMISKIAYDATSNKLCKFFGCWSIGVIFLVFFELLLQSFGIFSICTYTLLSIFLALSSKILSFRQTIESKPSYPRPLAKLKLKWPYVISILLGLIPPLYQTHLWPFPLKYDSDGFEISMLTLQIIKSNDIYIRASIHFPVESILLSIPCMLYNVQPTSYLWGLPFLVYPLFSFGVFILSMRFSGSKIVSLIASLFSMSFFGGLNNTFNLFMILPRNLVSLSVLFSFIIIDDLLRRRPEKAPINAGMVACSSLFIYATITFALSPSHNYLPKAFLAGALLLPLVLPIIIPRLGNLRYLFLLTLSATVSIVFIANYWFDIEATNFISMTFLTTIIGIASMMALDVLLYKRQAPDYTDPLIIGVAICNMLFYHQLALILIFILILYILINYANSHLNIFFRVLISLSSIELFLLLPYVISYSSAIASLMQLYGLHSLPWSDIFNNAFQVIEKTFNYTTFVLFLVGCLIALLQSKVREQVLVIIATTIILVYLIITALGFYYATRLIEFLPLFISYFAALPIGTLISAISSTTQIPHSSYNNIIQQKRYGLTFRLRVHTLKECTILILCVTILSPILTAQYLTFLTSIRSHSWTPYTYSIYEYQTGMWLKNNMPPNAIIISDPFTVLVMSGLTGNVITRNYRMIYDTKGNTHPIINDLETLQLVKSFFLTSDTKHAEELLFVIWSRYASNYALNRDIIDAKQNVSQTVFIVISGRTTAWLNSQSYGDIPFPQDFQYSISYQKFFESPEFDLQYQCEQQVYVFSWSAQRH